MLSGCLKAVFSFYFGKTDYVEKKSFDFICFIGNSGVFPCRPSIKPSPYLHPSNIKRSDSQRKCGNRQSLSCWPGYTYAPYNQRGQNGVEGLDIDIMNAIAKNQNFQVEYVHLEWNTLIQNAKTQNLSVVMDGIAADDLAAYPDYVLSQSYMRSGDCIYVAKPENAANWQTNKIALLPDDMLDEELVKQHGVNRNNIKHIRTLLDGFRNVASDEVQATVSDCGAARYVAKNPLFKDFQFHESVLPNSEQPETADLGFGVMKDDVELLNKINTGLQNIKQSGELDSIIKKWN